MRVIIFANFQRWKHKTSFCIYLLRLFTITDLKEIRVALERGCFGCMTFFGYEQEQKTISRRIKFIRDEQTNLDKRSWKKVSVYVVNESQK